MLFIHSYIIRNCLSERHCSVSFCFFCCCVAFYFVYSLFSLPLFCNHKYILATNENFLRFSNLVSIQTKWFWNISSYRQLYICICQVCTLNQSSFVKIFILLQQNTILLLLLLLHGIMLECLSYNY